MRVDVLIGHVGSISLLVALLGVYSSTSLWSFLDPLPFIVVLFVPVYSMIAIHGDRPTMGCFRLIVVWFKKRIPADFDPECFREGEVLSRSAQRLTWAAAWFTTLFNFHQALSLNNAESGLVSITGDFAICILPILYASAINLILWLPLERFAAFSFDPGRDDSSALARAVQPKPSPSEIFPKPKLIWVALTFIFGGWLGYTASQVEHTDAEHGEDTSAATEDQQERAPSQSPVFSSNLSLSVDASDVDILVTTSCSCAQKPLLRANVTDQVVTIRAYHPEEPPTACVETCRLPFKVTGLDPGVYRVDYWDPDAAKPSHSSEFAIR